MLFTKDCSFLKLLLYLLTIHIRGIEERELSQFVDRPTETNLHRAFKETIGLHNIVVRMISNTPPIPLRLVETNTRLEREYITKSREM